MKSLDAIVLAGGFAKRLSPLSEYLPKPLLPLGGVPLMNYIIDALIETVKPQRIIISTNAKFAANFKYWIKNDDNIQRYIDKLSLVVEPTRSNEEKFGAIRGLQYVIHEEWVEDDALIIAGDNFFHGFDLRKLRNLMWEKKSFVLAVYDIKSKEQATRYGVVEINDNNKIISFEEKPRKPKSTYISTGIYGIPKDKLYLIDEYIEQGNDRDALGKFYEWLLNKGETLYAYPFKQGVWFDIGTLEAYKRANEYVYSNNLHLKWI